MKLTNKCQQIHWFHSFHYCFSDRTPYRWSCDELASGSIRNKWSTNTVHNTEIKSRDINSKFCEVSECELTKYHFSAFRVHHQKSMAMVKVMATCVFSKKSRHWRRKVSFSYLKGNAVISPRTRQKLEEKTLCERRVRRHKFPVFPNGSPVRVVASINNIWVRGTMRTAQHISWKKCNRDSDRSLIRVG